MYELVNDAGEGYAAEGVWVHGEGGQLYLRAGQGEQVRQPETWSQCSVILDIGHNTVFLQAC